MKMKMKNSISLSLLAALAILLTACASLQNYGRFVINTEAEQAFNRYEVNPDYRYYTCGPDLFPNALLGLHQNYSLPQNTLWKGVQMNPGTMKETVENMKIQAQRFGQFPDAYRLIDAQGHFVGVWYSIREAVTYLRSEEDGILVIGMPPLDVFLKMEGSGNDNSHIN
ncbi:MAG: hypothetical protein FWE89_04885 [Syntrophaceae bacterium]|nr:hypothetical protein [Syntrophaceae bacterium]